jgi:uncharacterized membrane protein YhaH (DUF805 family)
MESFNYYIKAIVHYANFKGRARRKEYWFYVLYHSIFSVLLNFLSYSFPMLEAFYLSLIYTGIMFVPSLAVAVRRMHDLGKSGFLILIPFYNLYLLLQPGEINANSYGEDPKTLIEEEYI